MQAPFELSAQKIYELSQDLIDYKKEYFCAFFISARGGIIKRDIISIGTLTASLAHPREIFKEAINHSAAHILLAHNHPSENCEPSGADLTVTKDIARAGSILGIQLLDHVIVSKNGYCSLKEQYPELFMNT